MKTEPNEPANPFFTWNVAGYGDCVVIEDDKGNKQFLHYKSGLSKREYFAAMAMQGICANPTTDIRPTGTAIAIVSIEIADELLKQLER